MTVFPEIFDEDSLLRGYGKCREGAWKLESSSFFISTRIDLWIFT
jgi:hypothetical protein